MKQLYLLLAICLAFIKAEGQVVVKAEYFWDTDPGIGSGTVITIGSALQQDSVNITQTISTAGLSAGTHYLYIRTKDSNGHWSLSEGMDVNVLPLIVGAEYFWDTDPGVGNGTPHGSTTFTHLDSVNLSKTFSTTGLSSGTHFLYVRTLDSEGKWSLSEGTAFNIVPLIVDYEYFWDTDPGIGNGVGPMSGTPFTHLDSVNITRTLSTAALGAGMHFLYVRTLDSEGKWSLSEGMAVNVVPKIVGYEYFWDTDPGIGNGTGLFTNFTHLDSINITQSFSTVGLTGGYHIMYVRSIDNEGKWSLSEGTTFYIQPVITHAEVFWDTDPGIGNGTSVSVGMPLDSVNVNVVSTALSTLGLSAGVHYFYVRTKDSGNKWSLSEGKAVNVVPYIVKGEYFLNTDPGIGNGTVAFTVPQANYADSIAGNYTVNPGLLPYRRHYHYLRTMDNFGKWSLSEPMPFDVEMHITKVEYFFDTDPGVGLGTDIPITPNDTVILSNYPVSTASLTEGIHNLYIRALNDAGVWTPIDERTFYVEPAPLIYTNTQVEYFIDTDPGVGLATDIPVADGDTLSLINAPASVAGYGAGVHQLYIRAKNSLGVWSVIDQKPFFIDEPLQPVSAITQLECFFNTDPGIGNGINLPLPGAFNDTVIVNTSITLPCMANGTNYMWLRAKNNLGVWSVVDYDTLNVSTIVAKTIASTGPDTVCFPNTVTMYADSATGITYQWFNNSSPISGATFAAYTASATGNYSLRQTCNSGVATSNIKNVVVNNIPDITYCPSIAPVNNALGLCSAIVTYPPATATGSTPLPVITYSQNSGTAFPVGSTTVYVVATNLCGTDSCHFNVVVNDTELPVISNCPATVNLNNMNASCNAVATWIAPAASDNCAIQSFTSSHNSGSVFPVGTTTVTYTATDVHGNLQTCSFNVVVTDNELPSIICPASIFTCDTITTLGTPVTSDNCGIDTVYNNAPVVFPQGLTIVTWTVEDVYGNMNTCQQNVTIQGSNSLAADSIISNSGNNICLGNGSTISVAGGMLGIGDNWQWYSGSCGGTPVGSGGSITVSPAATTTYFVRAEGVCGNTMCVFITITVSNGIPAQSVVIPITGLPNYACNGTTAAVSIPAVANATQYTWDGPAGTTFNGNPSPYISTTPSVTVVFGNPNGSGYRIGVQAGNGCGSSLRKSQWVRGIVSTPAAVSGATTTCASTSGNYSTGAVDGVTAYLWTITGDASLSGTGTNVTVNFGPAWTGGTLCVRSQTPCYTSPAKCLVIGTSALPLNSISGPLSACPNDVLTFSVPASSGAASYAWTVPANSSITGGSGTNSIQVTFAPGYNNLGNICVNVTSICGVTSANKCRTVAPGVPSVPASIIGATNGLCGQSISYSTPSKPGTTYNWTAPGTITGNGSNAVSIAYGSFTTGQVCVTASTGCGTSAARCIAIKGQPNSPVALTAMPASWCANTSGVEFTANVSNTAGSYTLSWTYPSAPVATYTAGGGNTTSLILDWGTGNGTVIVSATNSCGTGSKAFVATVGCKEGEMTSASKLNVYPNPTAGVLNIEYTAEKGNAQVTVLDLSGRVVMTQTHANVSGQNNIQLDLSKVAKGAYMLNVQTNGSNNQVRVVVE